MPIVGVNGITGCPPQRGIPVRVAPQNICDVNPYVCRMTPANIDFKAKPPYVSKLCFEPHPRGCQCCFKALEEPTCYEGSTMVNRHYSPTYQPSTSRSPDPEPKNSNQSRSPDRDSQYMDPKKRKKIEKMQAKAEKRKSMREAKKQKQQTKQQKKHSKAAHKEEDYERIRLLREQKRRDDFVTRCCTGLLLTPCVSAGSCSEEAEEREQANFFIQCKCCPASANRCADQEIKRRPGADFPCQCRKCKYYDKGCTKKSGCLDMGTGELPVCYCTKEEQLEESPYRRCDEEPKGPCNDGPKPRDARSNQRGYFSQGDCSVCDELMPTQAALLTCTKAEGDGNCTKMVMTAELMQEMLIKQVQQGIQMANSLLTNKKFQLVDMTDPAYMAQTSQRRADVRPQDMQAIRNNQPVELGNNSTLKCCLQNVDPAELAQNCLCEPLPRPPLNLYQSANKEEDCAKRPVTLQCDKSTAMSSHSYHGESTRRGCAPSTHSMGTFMSYQRLPTALPEAGSGHICIPRDAILQDSKGPKLCIPLNFNQQIPMGSETCPYFRDLPEASGSNPKNLHSGPHLAPEWSKQGVSLRNVRAQDSKPAPPEESRNDTIACRMYPPQQNSQDALVKQQSSQDRKHRRDKHRRDSQTRSRRDSSRERRQKEPRRKRESDPDSRRQPRLQSDSEDPTSDVIKSRRKISSGPCEDDKGRRLSPTEMVRTLNGYETDLLQAMDKVKGKYLKKRGIDMNASTSAVSSDSVTPGLGEFNCLLKHIECLRKELKKHAKDERRPSKD